MAISDDIELGEMLVIIGAVGFAAYMLYKAVKGIPNPFNTGGSATDLLYNLTTGKLDCSQRESAAQTEAQEIVKASGGKISMADALKQGRADQNALHCIQSVTPVCCCNTCGYPVSGLVF
jgi:hypothetical protein